jgi:hypothetical protein
MDSDHKADQMDSDHRVDAGGELAEYRPRRRTAKQAALPPTLAPRLVNREGAAAYVCVSPTMFDEMVKSGKMPRPKLLGGRRKAWDVRALDGAVDDLPTDGNGALDATWSDIDATQASTIC